MCVIYVCNSNVPDEWELAGGALSNSDGAGVAWREKGVIKWEKGIDEVKDVMEITKKVKLPIVIHFRTASAGPAIPELTHPFPLVKGIPLDLTGSAPAVLFHNGHMTNWEEKYLNFILGAGEEVSLGEFSDTRAMAHMITPCG